MNVAYLSSAEILDQFDVNERLERESRGGFQWIDTSRWDATPCPPREWAVRDQIPLRQVTLFSGEGAIGKSIVELMLCVAHVLGKDWLGSLPEPGDAFYLGCEDDEPELRIRLSAIAAHYGTTFAGLRAGGLHFKSLAGDDAVLGAPDRNGIIRPTALYDQLYEEAGDRKPKHIGIDTSADAFAGNEVDRAQVRQFISMLRRLAIVADGSVVLLSHPSLTGINTGSGISGSTAWHNSVRARMYMTAPKIESGEQPDTDVREIQFKKSNYGRVADSMVLRYQHGLFLPEQGMSSLDKLAREQRQRKCSWLCSPALETRDVMSAIKRPRRRTPPHCSPRKGKPRAAAEVIWPTPCADYLLPKDFTSSNTVARRARTRVWLLVGRKKRWPRDERRNASACRRAARACCRGV